MNFQDSFIISSEKLKHGWTLTTSQYTITHIVYFKTQEQLLKIQKLLNKQTSNLCNLHTYTHAPAHTDTHAALTFEWIYLFRNAIDCIRFRYAKSSTRWKKLIMFSKDMAIVICYENRRWPPYSVWCKHIKGSKERYLLE